MQSKAITRSELYELVWQQPMLRLAERFSLSDVGLAKICRKYDIPRPPRGYWAKLQHGQTPKQTPLPERDRDEKIELREQPIQEPSPLREKAAGLVEEEQKSAERVEVAADLRGCHELINRANAELKAAETDDARLIVLPNDASLAVRTTKANLRRGLLIMDAVIKALESRGHAVESGPSVSIFDTSIRFGLSEPLKTTRDAPKDHSLEGRYEFGHSRFERRQVASGRLMLEIEERWPYWSPGCQRTWRDTKKTPLERRLNSFIAGLIEMAARVREEEEERNRRAEELREQEKRRQEAAQRRAERRKMYKEEEARVEQLMAQAEDYRRSCLVRQLIKAVREAHGHSGPIQPQSEIGQWLEWATQQADRLDPLQPSPPSILDEAELKEDRTNRYGYRW